MDTIVVAVGGKLTWQELDKYNPDHELFWTNRAYSWHPDPEKKHKPIWMRDEEYVGVWLPITIHVSEEAKQH